jgi:hypothetical protein
MKNAEQAISDFDAAATEALRATWQETEIANHKFEAFKQGILEGKDAATLFGEAGFNAANKVKNELNEGKSSADRMKEAFDQMRESISKQPPLVEETKQKIDQAKSSQDGWTGAVHETASAYEQVASSANKAASAVSKAASSGSSGGYGTSTFTVSTPEKAWMTPAERAAYEKYMADEMLQMVKDINKEGFLPFEPIRTEYGAADPLQYITDADRYLAAQFERGDIGEAGLTDRAKELLMQSGNNYYFIDTPIAKSDMETIIRQTDLTEAMA